MTTPKPITPPDATHAYEPRSPSAKIEEIASEADLAAGGALRAVEVAAVALLGLLVCPPLMILVVVVVVPLLVMALVLGLVAAVLSTPYLLVHHFRGHDGGHLSLLAHRLRHDAPRGVALAMILGGPSVYLLGESLFRWRMTGVTKAQRVAVAALLILLVPLGGHVEALPLSIVVATLLTVLAVCELRSPGLVETSGRARWRSLAPERS